jgi:hypothetical protein
MLDQLTHAKFATLVGQRFRLHVNDAKIVEVELIEVVQLPTHAGRGAAEAKRSPFSLVFRGPREFVLPQRIYPVEQESLGKAEIFLVPIGPDEIGQRYEAVFN